MHPFNCFKFSKTLLQVFKSASNFKEKPRLRVTKALFWRTIQLFKERLSKFFSKSVLVKQKTPVFLARIGDRKKKHFMENLEWLLHNSFLFSGDFWFLFVDNFMQFSAGPSCSKGDKAMSLPNTYALDGDLSIGKCYNYIQHLNNRDLELTCPLLVLPQLQEWNT